MSILIPFVWDKMVCLDNCVEFSIFNFVIGHNRKIPSDLTKTHEADIPERALKGLTGGVK